MKSWIAIIGGALALFCVFQLVFWLLYPFLPSETQLVIQQISSSDVTELIQLARKQTLIQANTQGYLFFFCIQIAQVLIAPIPGQLMGLLGGYIFGFWYGLALTMLGLGVGSGLAMLMGRLWGNKIIHTWLPQKWVDYYQDLLDTGGVLHFFMLFLLPAFPDDALCFLAGMSRLPLKYLWLSALVGRLPGMVVLSYFGAASQRLHWTYYVVLGGLCLVLFVFEKPIRLYLEAALKIHKTP